MSASWRDRRVLVTGATGLVGSHLTRTLLEQGAAVGVFVPELDPQSELVRAGTVHRTRVFQGTLEDLAALRRTFRVLEPEVVFHLGAQALVEQGVADPLGTFETNIRGSYHLLEACRGAARGPRVVVASSDKAYGDSLELPYVEDHPPRPRFPYDASKACADLLAQTYFHTYALPVAIARCGNIYGPGDLQWSRIVPGTIRSVLRDERPVLRSDGSPRRDYVYVQDVVEAYLRLAEGLEAAHVRGQAFNFGLERPVAASELVELICGLMGRKDLEPVVLGMARQEIRDQWLSSAKARDVLGWNHRYTLRHGLEETIPWYRRRLEAK